jgi:carboxypeptidase Taq
MSIPEQMQPLAERLREIAVLGSVSGVLSWDQETMMPHDGASLRAEQRALLAALAHDRLTDPVLAEELARCEADGTLQEDAQAAADLREIRRDVDRATRLPSSLVREFAETTSRALEAWKDARAASDFAAFAPWLERVMELNRSMAECHSAPEGGDLYDALLEEYEPGMRAATIDGLFAELRGGLTGLLEELREGSQPDDRIHDVRTAIERQRELNRAVVAALGLRMESARLDTSTHPFCQGMGPGDTRITTRYREDGFPEALSSTMHEAGHALYEQGLPKERYFGLPRARSVSLGIHESQSRLWENFVGRSRPFWKWALPLAQDALGHALDVYEAEPVFRAMNIVRPSLIRVESDEVTYNLHIMLRYDLERAMLSGDLPVGDLPGAWNERIRADLGIEVPDDAHGCLQDIHWAMGAVGYFPTYTLGNLYAGQLWRTIGEELPELDADFQQGEFGALLGWLRERVHAHGSTYTAPELCERITGAPVGTEPLMGYLRAKLREVYRLDR